MCAFKNYTAVLHFFYGVDGPPYMSEEAEANYRKAEPQVKRRKRSGSCAWVFRYFASTVKS